MFLLLIRVTCWSSVSNENALEIEKEGEREVKCVKGKRVIYNSTLALRNLRVADKKIDQRTWNVYFS